MTALQNNSTGNSRLWIYPARIVLGLAGLLISAGSWFAINVMIGFWLESNLFPNAFAEFAAGPGLTAATIMVSAWWIWRSFRGFRMTPWDSAILLPPATGIFLAFYLGALG